VRDGSSRHALAYNLANFLRGLALPGEIAKWSLITLREKVVEIGAKVVAHGRAEATGKTAHLAGAALRQPSETDVSQACTTDAQCSTSTPSYMVDEVEVGGRLDAVVDLVQRRLQQAQAAGRNVSPAVADFNTPRETICMNLYPNAFGFLEKTYNSLSNF
jgi:hypothetical protein